MMKVTRMNALTLAVALLAFALAAWYYPSLPDPVPTHWNIAGEVDGWTAKPMGVWIFPLITLGLAVVMLVLPAISPRGFRLDAARRSYDIVLFLLVGFMVVVEAFSYRAALSGGSSITQAIPVMLGLLLIGLGNYLGKFPKNFFVGIRTPWTLASDQVWNRTHRLAGFLFMAAGVLVILSGFFNTPSWVFVSAIVTAAVVPAVYSLLLYRRLHGFGATDNTDD
jgi:uncharacterized membrane protein